MPRILILPAVAAIAMLVYVLVYRYGKRVGIRIGRRKYEAWREMRYCGTAQAHMAEVAKEIRQPEGKYGDA